MPQASARPGNGPAGFRVLGDDKPVVDGLSACLNATFKDKADYEIVSKLPAAELILYVNRDANDRVNPKGVSIAVAHVSNTVALFVANKLLIDPRTKTDDPNPQGAAAALVRQEGNLDHLSVAHIDDPSPEETRQVCQSVAETVFAKNPAMAGK